MSDLRHPFVLLSALCFATVCAATCADAQSGVGVAVGHSNRFDKTFVRGELAIAVDETWTLVPNLEYVQANGVRRYVSSLDLHYRLPWCFAQRRLCGYLGTGVGIITEDPVGTDHSSTHDGQINFLGGVLFDGPVVPFFEIRSDARKVNYLLGARLTF